MSDTTSNETAPGLALGTMKSKIMLGLGVLALTAVIAAAVFNLRDSQYSVLFTNLSDHDGGAIIADLAKKNIPYRFAAGGNAILVPASDVHQARLGLAAQGLPRGANVGFEIIDAQGFGVTQFQERLNYQRALQGELARSIASLAAVESARVHLSIPDKRGFLRERARATASVILKLFPGQSLSKSQSSGIVHLVAASLGDLKPDDVTVIDQSGALLVNRPGEQLGPDPSQLAYIQGIESRLNDRIVAIVEPIVGKGNVRARVTADVDFTATQSTDETYRPNQSLDSAAVRSKRLRGGADGSAVAAAGGIPGALSNQPPPAGAAPINGQPQQTGAATTVTDSNGANGKSGESVINYEVDKSVRVTKAAVGNISRLTAAVVVNHQQSVDANGKVTMTPLSDAQMQTIQTLVQQAIGFNAQRQDSVSVMNSAFVQEAPVELASVPIWQDPHLTGLALQVIKYVGLILLGVLTIFKVIRPALQTMMAPPPAESAGGGEGTGDNRLAVVADDVDLPVPENPRAVTGQATDEAKRLAQESPVAVASVVREWVGQE